MLRCSTVPRVAVESRFGIVSCSTSSRWHVANVFRLQTSTSRNVQRFAGDSEAMPSPLSSSDAYKLLGVNASSGFEEVLQAKKRKLAANDGDQEKIMEIETAYDMIFMQSMKRRLSGELEVSTSVRYADVPVNPREKKNAAQRRGGSQKTMLSSLPSVGGVSLQAPPQNQATTTQVAVFAALCTWSLVQAVLETPDAQLADTAGLQMALALGYSVYNLKEIKRMNLGKAFGVSIACLIFGALFGSALQNWLRVDIVPIGGFGSPGVFVTEFIILSMALGSLFLI